MDPSTGLLMLSDNANGVYYESLGIDHFLKGYKSVQIGMCRVVDHPVFGLDCYPATIFTNAPEKLIREILDGFIINKSNNSIKNDEN